MADIIPAATLVIFREAAAGPPELLMVERAATMAFAAGATVFPGGRVDPADRLLAATLDGDADEQAARIAAIRETIEETGIGPGLLPDPDGGEIAAIRSALGQGVPFGDALALTGSTPATDRLVPFARWLPDHAARRFDTRFYLAELSPDAPEPRIDETENVRLCWSTAGGMLAEAAAGRAALIYPTRRNLERLARFASFAEAVADARAHRVTTITPWVERRDGEDWLCIPEGLGYPVTAQRLATVQRG